MHLTKLNRAARQLDVEGVEVNLRLDQVFQRPPQNELDELLNSPIRDHVEGSSRYSVNFCLALGFKLDIVGGKSRIPVLLVQT
jgi:hypothetical protein